MNQTLSHWLPRRLLRPVWVVCAGSLASAQEPAARLGKAVPADTPAAVARGSAPTPPSGPGYQFQAPTSVPAPNAPRPSAPAQPSVWGGVKGMFTSTKPPEPPAEPPKPWWPTTPPAKADPAQPTSITGNGTTPAAPALPPPQSYAGPPAYRWYGYGSPATGANPYAPAGRYPQAPAAWLAQTGATAGAFPVPVGGATVNPREQPPVLVQSVPQETSIPQHPDRPVTSKPTPERTDPVPSRVSLIETQREPVMPSGNGVRVEPTAPEVSWQPISASSRAPIAATTGEAAKPMPVPEQPAEWTPSKRATPADAPLPTVSISRGQAPAATEPDVDGLIRTACFGRATRVGVERPGPQRLHVTLVVPTESDARDAAGVVSRLPELKTYTVTFEAVIGK